MHSPAHLSRSYRPCVPSLRQPMSAAVRARLERLSESWSVPPAAPPSPSPVPREVRTRLDPRAWRALIAVLVAASAIAAWMWWNGRPLAMESAPVAAMEGGIPASALEPEGGAGGLSAGQVTVHVVGLVHQPGLVELPAGSRVADAIEAAGGAVRAKALASVNLARILIDGEQIIVAAVGASGVSGSGSGSSLLSLGTADAAALEALPGIGPVLAQRIVAWRTEHGPFASVDALGDVPGIGPSLLGQVRSLVTP